MLIDLLGRQTQIQPHLLMLSSSTGIRQKSLRLSGVRYDKSWLVWSILSFLQIYMMYVLRWIKTLLSFVFRHCQHYANWQHNLIILHNITYLNKNIKIAIFDVFALWGFLPVHLYFKLLQHLLTSGTSSMPWCIKDRHICVNSEIPATLGTHQEAFPVKVYVFTPWLVSRTWQLSVGKTFGLVWWLPCLVTITWWDFPCDRVGAYVQV